MAPPTPLTKTKLVLQRHPSLASASLSSFRWKSNPQNHRMTGTSFVCASVVVVSWSPPPVRGGGCPTRRSNVGCTAGAVTGRSNEGAPRKKSPTRWNHRLRSGSSAASPPPSPLSEKDTAEGTDGAEAGALGYTDAAEVDCRWCMSLRLTAEGAFGVDCMVAVAGRKSSTELVRAGQGGCRDIQRLRCTFMCIKPVCGAGVPHPEAGASVAERLFPLKSALGMGKNAPLPPPNPPERARTCSTHAPCVYLWCNSGTRPLRLRWAHGAFWPRAPLS